MWYNNPLLFTLVGILFLIMLLPAKIFAAAVGGSAFATLGSTPSPAPRIPTVSHFSTIEPNRVLPQLYIGDFGISNDSKFLTDNKITHIVDASGYPRTLPAPEGISLLTITVGDSPVDNISQYFEKTNAFISKAIDGGGNVLVNCYMGISRSASIVAAYLIARRRMSTDEAIYFIRRTRNVINPNPGFLVQLREFEASQRRLWQ